MESYTIESNKKKSRLPARLDFAQSATGLILGLFIWMHLLFDGSIIFGKKAFSFVTGMLELSFLSDTGHGYPIIVFFAVTVISILFITHALLGMRKFPNSYRQHRIMADQVIMMDHMETRLWYVQAITGFIMFFAGSVHLYTMFANPGSVDPYLSADRVVSGNMWFLYLVLLVCVVLHANIGLYRLCLKWGWFSGKDARKSRLKLQLLRNRIIIFYLVIGVLGILAFTIVGMGHRDKAGERYRGQVTSVEIPQGLVAQTRYIEESNQ
nr:fumarate reductase cytochrome b subunit [Desulfobacula sp.]